MTAYCVSIIIALSLFLSFGMQLSAAYLKNSYQIYSVYKIAQLQQSHGGYYLPMNAEYQYKMALLKIRKPEIIILGTSRVLGFRQWMFNVSFVNMGRTFGDVAMLSTVKDILRIHKPKVIIWGIDWWDFIQNSRTQWAKRNYNGTEIVFPQLLMPYEWIFQGKISLTEFIQVALKRTANGLDNNSFSVPARHHVEGYAKDGSIHYFAALQALTSSSYRFRKALREILTSAPKSGYFQVGKNIPRKKWVEFRQLQRLLKNRDVILITYLIPEPTPIMAAMKQSHHYGYLDELQNDANRLNPFFYDYMNPKKLEASSCEFIDDLHSGDIMSMRILLMLSRDHHNGLYKYINERKLQMLVNTYAGRASIPIPNDRNSVHETDFLGMGCHKKDINLSNAF
ncbi:hypothetical protein [Candidiatus Paracoxiella cheracis]|uniref:hypothetical protein n=1 Tax=Candidiatus Paracoxiella cheracis TaxID=3405120 RepID=UPI003BF50F80